MSVIAGCHCILVEIFSFKKFIDSSPFRIYFFSLIRYGRYLKKLLPQEKSIPQKKKQNKKKLNFQNLKMTHLNCTLYLFFLQCFCARCAWARTVMKVSAGVICKCCIACKTEKKTKYLFELKEQTIEREQAYSCPSNFDNFNRFVKEPR